MMISSISCESGKIDGQELPWNSHSISPTEVLIVTGLITTSFLTLRLRENLSGKVLRAKLDSTECSFILIFFNGYLIACFGQLGAGNICWLTRLISLESFNDFFLNESDLHEFFLLFSILIVFFWRINA